MVIRSKLKYGLAISLALITPCLAHADTLFVDTWSSNASINGEAVSGQFVYDATTNSISSDTTAIAGLCTSGTCLLSPFNPTALNVGAVASSPPVIAGEPKFIAFNDGVTLGGLGVPGTNPILAAFQNDFSTELPVTGSLLVSPGPTPGEGLLSVALILLMGLSARFRSLIV